jgi:predicted metal-binding protein
MTNISQQEALSGSVSILVCGSCRAKDNANDRPGLAFSNLLRKRLEERHLSIPVQEIECFAVCKRPVTIAFAARNKWTYLLGDLDAERHIDELIDAAFRYGASDNGLVPWKERPECFKKGVLSRTPPPSF